MRQWGCDSSLRAIIPDCNAYSLQLLSSGTHEVVIKIALMKELTELVAENGVENHSKG